MKLNSLELLHRSMLRLPRYADMQQFQIKIGISEFDCLFSTRGFPYSLALTSRGEQPEFLLFQVSKTYEVSNSLDEKVYLRLASVLAKARPSNSKLVPKDFFTDLDALIPAIASESGIPSPKAILKLRSDITQERDRPHFSHWRGQGVRSVSEDNRIKTREMLGQKALEYSGANNLSSSWSPAFVRFGWLPVNKSR